MNHHTDKTTSRIYIKAKIDGFDLSKLDLNKENLLVGSLHNSARVPQNDGTLVIFEKADPAQLYASITDNFSEASELNHNFMRFFLEGGHAILELTCIRCNNTQPTHIFADLNSDFRIWTESQLTDQSIVKYILERNNYDNALKILLTDSQAKKVLSSINHIASLGNKDYDYVEWSHNCASALTDIYKYSGFDRHFSEYMTDTELLASESSTSETHGITYLHRYHDFSFKHDITRPQISMFMKNLYGDDFGTRWRGPEGLDKEPVNTTLLTNYPEVQKRYEEAFEIINKVKPLLIKEYLLAIKANLSNELLTNAFDLLGSEVTNNDLYYFNVYKHKYEIFQNYKNEPYVKHLFSMHEVGLDDILVHCRLSSGSANSELCSELRLIDV